MNRGDKLIDSLIYLTVSFNKHGGTYLCQAQGIAYAVVRKALPGLALTEPIAGRDDKGIHTNKYPSKDYDKADEEEQDPIRE